MPRNYISPRKKDLRRRLRLFRTQLAPAEAAARSRAIVANLKTLAELEHANTIHVYWPRIDTREIDICPLISWLQGRKKKIVLPVVEPSDDHPALSHAQYEKKDLLRPNMWGILEPIGDKCVALHDIDAVIVPALGADHNGHRIGYGKGYYDAFLQQLEVPFICPVYTACLIDHIPVEPHDVPMNLLVTESDVLLPNATRIPGMRT